MVRWNGGTSRFFHIFAGVRQGGILSPLLFAVYIDVIVHKLEQSGYGCKIHGLYIGCILYADDMILLAQTSHDMQCMLDICQSEIVALDLQFNVSKSVVMRVGPRWNACCAEFVLGTATLKFVDSVKYLGVYFKSGKKFSCTYDHLKLRYYSSFNALYSRSKSSNSELVSIELVKSFCLPVLLYGIEVTGPRKSAFNMLNNLINRAVHKIFNISDNSVIQDIRDFVGLCNTELLHRQRHEKFLKKTYSLMHPVLQTFGVTAASIS